MRHPLAIAAGFALMAAGPAAADGVRIGVSVPVPAPPTVVVTPPRPPVVVAAPPQLVVVPGSPVFYAPGASMNFFAYGGQYYPFHEGAWFVAKEPWPPLGDDRARQGAPAGPRGAGRVLQGSAGAREEGEARLPARTGQARPLLRRA